MVTMMLVLMPIAVVVVASGVGCEGAGSRRVPAR